ncbi:PREDICTED: uncharacterized protein LOC106124809 [Papilio xuthus]|uniref:Uncharacterized protein LOC106124809 n=1 Tax=Papilio xuthus TaxID=66420 RepID=A0AAJ6ZQE3_PAPXU|nr:PREDICTED: uncharacterized protein LOC106124809 [Papilio xuthus]
MYWFAVVLIAIPCAQAQLTAQSSLAPDLRECYTVPQLVDRNNLPPATMPVLIDIIRKIEDNPNVNVDLRQLAVLLLHTYRQDGIEFHQPEVNLGAASTILPFAPTFHSFYRHRLLLTRIIPGNLQTLSNTTVNSELKCALHHMLSTTVDARLRGNENSCNQLSQYRALRTARDVTLVEDDVEIIDLATLKAANKNGHMRHHNPKDDVEYAGIGDAKSERQVLGQSTCPILGGVVNTRWGAVSAGHLIAGIAAGAELQQVPVLELAKSSFLNYNNVQQSVTSIYPATLSGDLAEAVLIQGTERGNPSISIGTAGNWNSSQATRFYMLHSRINVEMTDPEIRGDIDGFVLGTILSSVLSASNTLKLSQLLDMYYTPRNGVYNSNLRACNRQALSQQYITATNLASETYTFAAALDTNIPLRGTITGGMEDLVNSAITNFQTYASNNLNDLNCVTTEATSVDYRFKTNLYVVLDAMWQFQAVYPAISYLIDNIEVSKYGSSITLLSAFDGSVIVNKTFSISDFHTNYTLLRHQSLPTGVNMETSLTNIRIMMHSELENERTANYVGGNSSVLLFLLSSGNIQITQNALDQARILNETVPDLRILFATATNQFDNLWSMVRDVHNDIKTVSLNTEGTNVEITMNPVLDRIAQVGRRIINPTCGSTYPSDSTSGTRQFEDFVEPGYINYYAISPNYFYQNNGNRRVRISRSGVGTGSLIVCFSRSTAQPRQNATLSGLDEGAVTCQTLATTGNVEIGLQNPCEGYWTINSCPFYYISIQSSVAASTSLSAVCTENACRFPYSMRYQVQIEEFGCFSSAGSLGVSVGLLLSAILYSLFSTH